MQKSCLVPLLAVAAFVVVLACPLPAAHAATVSITISTIPASLPNSFTVNGTTYSSTQTFASLPGDHLTIAAASTISGASGTQYVWKSWSDGGAISHVITVPNQPSTTYYAIFTTQYYLTVVGGSGGANGQGYYDSGTVANATSQGVFGRSAGTGSRTSSYSIDSGATVPLATSGVATVSVAMKEPNTVYFNVVQQYQLTLDAGATLALSSITSPPVAGDNYWYDYGTTVTYNGTGVYGRVAGTGSRISGWWLDGGSTTRVLTSGNFVVSIPMTSIHTLHTAVVTQHQLTLSGSPAVAYVTTPTILHDDYWYDNGTLVTLMLNGTFGRSDGMGTRLVSYTINGGHAVTVASGGVVNVLVDQPIVSAETMAATTTTQYQLSVSGGSAVSYSLSPPITGDVGWYDSGSSVTVTTNRVWDTNASESRMALTGWILDGTSQKVARQGSGTFTTSPIVMKAPHLITFTSVTQYFLTVNGGSGIFFGTPSPTADAWYDAGTSTTVSSEGVWGRVDGVGQRLSSWSLDGGPSVSVATANLVTTPQVTMSTFHTVTFNSVTQYQLSLSGAAAGAVYSVTLPQIPGDNYWYDSGTAVSLTLSGVFGRSGGSGFRLISYAVNGGAALDVSTNSTLGVLSSRFMDSPLTISAAVKPQYEVVLNKAAQDALSSITPPTLPGDAYWYDSGTAVTVQLNSVWARGSGTGFRLASYSLNGAGAVGVTEISAVTALDTTSIGFPQSINATVVTQYLLTVEGGGTSLSPAPPIRGDADWYDAGTDVTVSANATFSSNGASRQRVVSWSLDGGTPTLLAAGSGGSTGPITMSAPHTIIFNSVAQYREVFVVVAGSGYPLLTPALIQVSSSGQTLTATGGSIWLDNGSSFTIQTIAWHAVDIQPLLLQTYTVPTSGPVLVVSRVYDATITVVDTLGLPVSGAQASITLANGTEIHALSDSNGHIVLNLIPLGLYSGTISYLGLSAPISGNAAVQGLTQTKVALSYAEITLVAIATVLACVFVFLGLKLRDKGRPKPTIPHPEEPPVEVPSQAPPA